MGGRIEAERFENLVRDKVERKDPNSSVASLPVEVLFSNS